MRLDGAMNSDSTKYLVIGAGVTGCSVAEYLHAQNKNFRIMDSRDVPPNASKLKRLLPKSNICFGEFRQEWIDVCDIVVLSPGVSLQMPEFQNVKLRGAEVIGDVELFARNASKPYITITGSNGKSTVTTLVTEILNSQGVKAVAGANIGKPALDLLNEDVDMYVLELSSFQLETSPSIQPAAAVVLNISPDHLDRHKSFEEYSRIKQSIYNNAKHKVYRRVDRLSEGLPEDSTSTTFGLDEPADGHYGVQKLESGRWLMRGKRKLLPAGELHLVGRSGELNVLAALALTQEYITDQAAAIDCVREFKGLPHRCELVLEHAGVQWINDSKGTNVGATIAAIDGISRRQILILGGIHKGGSIESLIPVVREKVKQVVAFGRDREVFVKALQDIVCVTEADSLKQAVQIAASSVAKGEAVLFSPACASFDMFSDYQDRGIQFRNCVNKYAQKGRHAD